MQINTKKRLKEYVANDKDQNIRKKRKERIDTCSAQSAIVKMIKIDISKEDTKISDPSLMLFTYLFH